MSCGQLAKRLCLGLLVFGEAALEVRVGFERRESVFDGGANEADERQPFNAGCECSALRDIGRQAKR